MDAHWDKGRQLLHDFVMRSRSWIFSPAAPCARSPASLSRRTKGKRPGCYWPSRAGRLRRQASGPGQDRGTAKCPRLDPLAKGLRVLRAERLPGVPALRHPGTRAEVMDQVRLAQVTVEVIGGGCFVH